MRPRRQDQRVEHLFSRNAGFISSAVGADFFVEMLVPCHNSSSRSASCSNTPCVLPNQASVYVQDWKNSDILLLGYYDRTYSCFACWRGTQFHFCVCFFAVIVVWSPQCLSAFSFSLLLLLSLLCWKYLEHPYVRVRRWRTWGEAAPFLRSATCGSSRRRCASSPWSASPSSRASSSPASWRWLPPPTSWGSSLPTPGYPLWLTTCPANTWRWAAQPCFGSCRRAWGMEGAREVCMCASASDCKWNTRGVCFVRIQQR